MERRDMKKRNCFFTLYKYEIFKIFKNKVAFATFLIFFVFSFIQGEFEVRGNLDPEDLPRYQAMDGRVIDDGFISEMLAATDEMGEPIDPGELEYDGVRSWVRDIWGYRTALTGINESTVYHKREESIAETYEDLKLSEGEIAYWQEREQKLEKPFAIYDTAIISGVLEGTTNFIIYMIMIVGISLAAIFAIETQRRTDPMIRSSINGRTELYFAKILAGMTYSLTGLLIIVAGFLTYVGLAWGFTGMQAAVQIYLPLAAEDMTMWQLEGIILIMLFTFTFMLSAFALFVSNVTRNSLASMGIVIGACFGIFALSTSVPLKMRILSQTISILSPSIVSSNILYDFRLIKLGRYLTEYQAAPMIYIALSIILTVAGCIIYLKHEIKSN